MAGKKKGERFEGGTVQKYRKVNTPHLEGIRTVKREGNLSKRRKEGAISGHFLLKSWRSSNKRNKNTGPNFWLERGTE